ncbi:MAG: PDZ domain-containing protein [Planctomycetaceae bacterium]|nr:PDZ domain-containing protein [Planctomycetaceae bacterium]
MTEKLTKIDAIRNFRKVTTKMRLVACVGFVSATAFGVMNGPVDASWINCSAIQDLAEKNGFGAAAEPLTAPVSTTQETARQETPAQETPPQEAPPQEAPPQEAPPQEAPPQERPAPESGPQDPPSPEAKPEGGQPQEGSQETPPGEDGAKQEPPADAPPQNDQNSDAQGADESDGEEQPRRRRTSRFLQYTKFNEHIQNLLKEQVRSVANSTVEVYVEDGETPVALGMIVDAKGFVMTKASMLKGAAKCKLANGRIVPAIVYGVDTETDLALLRLQATNLSPVTWSLQPEQEALEGFWVMSPGIDGSVKSLGVVSVAPRKIPSVSGFIGIQMQPHAAGVEVTQVIAGTAADRFGLKVADVIIAINDDPVAQPTDLSAVLRTKQPGDVVSLSVKRGETTLALRVVLGNREEDSPDNQRAVDQNTMSGEISKRRDNFPVAFQHDSVLTPEECGGPLVDLEGRVIGINISRAGRVNSYALPASLVQTVFQRLVTGEFSPEVVFAERLKGYETVLLSLNVEEVKLAAEKSEMENEAKQHADAVAKAKESIEQLQQQIETLKKQIESTNGEVESAEDKESQVRSKIRSKEREITKTREQKEQLEKEKKELLFGAN